MRFCTLVSGSSGNCVYINEKDAHILVDAGLSLRALTARLSALGVELHQLSGLLVTHEHGDHTKGLFQFAKRTEVPIFCAQNARAGIADRTGIPENRLSVFFEREQFGAGAFSVQPFAVPHDVPCVGYRIAAEGGALGVATDIGHLSQSLLEGLAGVDFALIEANHDVDLLRFGDYPAALKRRILSASGHLSNADCGELAHRLMESGCRHFLLGHLSHNNNLPSLALEAVCRALASNGARPGQVTVDVAPRFDQSPLFEFEAGRHLTEAAV